MAINRVEIKDFLVFKGEFALDFCPGVNIFIGGNGTGKTTLLRILYRYHANTHPLNKYDEDYGSLIFDNNKISIYSDFSETEGVSIARIGDVKHVEGIKTVFIPEKDFLPHAKGLPETAKYGKAELMNTEVDIIEKARVLASVPEQPLYREICDLIGGEPEHDGQSFFMKRPEIEKPIHFSLEASGFRKLGLLALLIRNEMIQSGSILFWDEPENSLNPELIPKLVDILLELSRSGVQIFIATHSYDVARWFELNKTESYSLRYFNMRENGGGIVADVADDYMSLPNSVIEDAGNQLLQRVTEVAAKNAGVNLK